MTRSTKTDAPRACRASTESRSIGCPVCSRNWPAVIAGVRSRAFRVTLTSLGEPPPPGVKPLTKAKSSPTTAEEKPTPATTALHADRNHHTCRLPATTAPSEEAYDDPDTARLDKQPASLQDRLAVRIPTALAAVAAAAALCATAAPAATRDDSAQARKVALAYLHGLQKAGFTTACKQFAHSVLVAQKLTVATCAQQYVSGKYAKVAEIFASGSVKITKATIKTGRNRAVTVVMFLEVNGSPYRYKFLTGPAFGPGEKGRFRIYSVTQV